MKWYDKAGCAVLAAAGSLIASSIVQAGVAPHGHGQWINIIQWWIMHGSH